MSGLSVSTLFVSESLQGKLGIWMLVGLLATLVVLWRTTSTDIPKIRNLYEIPRALPLFGHLLQLGDDHATTCERWWHQHKAPIFQIRLGNTRAVVVNSFSAAKQMLIGHQSALISRPTLYTFHGVISSTQGFTIGSSPWDTSCKNRRRAAGQTLNRAALRNYHAMYDLESYCIVRDLHRDSHSGTHPLNPRPYLQRFALNTTLTLCYGIRMDKVYDTMLREILQVGSAISLLRSASENYQDYIPLFRWWPTPKTQLGKHLRARRDAYLDTLLQKVRTMIDRGTEKPCIASAILKDTESKLTNVEVGSICLSLVSGGFETIPGTLTSCLGSLSTSTGQKFQAAAHEAITSHYTTPHEAWSDSILDEKIPYINAIVRESVRYYTVSAMSLPRKTVSDVHWTQPDGTVAVIPADTMVLINAQAANHDTAHYGSDADTFNPERWLERTDGRWTDKNTSDGGGIQHFGFGAGSRACSGQAIANRLMYAALVRVLSCYRVVASEDHPPCTDYVEYNAAKSALVAIPRDFEVRLVPREGVDVQGLLDVWAERTEGFYVEE